MQATQLLRDLLREAHASVEECMADVTPEQAHWHPGGDMVNSLGGNYAHIIVVEDIVINALLKGRAPFFASSWAGKTGLSTLPPLPQPGIPGLPSWHTWSTEVHIDLPSLRSYAQAIYATADDYLATLLDEQLDLGIDVFGAGEQSIKWIFSNFVLGHAFSHAGELACLKGLQGLRGYAR